MNHSGAGEPPKQWDGPCHYCKITTLPGAWFLMRGSDGGKCVSLAGLGRQR